MNNKNNVTIAVLTLTATLLITVLWLTTGVEPAVAAQAESRGDSYALAVVRATSSQDLLYVLDLNTEQLNAYTADKDTRNREIILVAGPFDLQRMTQGAEAARSPMGDR